MKRFEPFSAGRLSARRAHIHPATGGDSAAERETGQAKNLMVINTTPNSP